MSTFMKSKGSKTAMWFIMALLIVGLGGFGLTGAFQGASGSAVATVGDQDVTVDQFYSGVQQDLRNLSEQLGTQLTMEQGRAFGVDQNTLRRLINIAALNNEADNLNISAGNDAVKAELLNNPAFQGLTGGFDENAYNFALEQQNLSRVEYDELVRANLSQILIRDGVSLGSGNSDIAANTIMGFLGETRSLVWTVMSDQALTTPVPAPTGAELRQYYDDNPALFTEPETRQITYVALTIDMAAQGLEIDETLIEDEYASRAARYNIPASRIVDRILFVSMDEAGVAMDSIAAGVSDFEAVAAARGLTAADIAVGLVLPDQLSANTSALLFASEEPGIYGPIDSDRGPAIFRVNAVIAAKTTTLDEAREEITLALAQSQAQDVIVRSINNIDDLLASGATLEEIADETDMQLFSTAFNANSTGDIETDTAFMAEATAAELDEERDILELASGGVFVLRVDGITDAFVKPLADTRQIAIDGQTAIRTVEMMVAQAEEIKLLLETGADLSATAQANDLQVFSVDNVNRGGGASDLPPEVSDGALDLPLNGAAVFNDALGVYLVQVTRIDAFDPSNSANVVILSQAATQIAAEIGNDMFTYYANSLVNQAGVTINQPLIDQLLLQLQ